jgi:hypothetical protein
MPGPSPDEQVRVENVQLREALSTRDAENAELRATVKSLLLRVAELERQRGSGSDDSGTPSSKEPTAAKARRTAERKACWTRTPPRGNGRRDRSRGGQPGHPGHGLARDPDPQHREHADPPQAGTLRAHKARRKGRFGAGASPTYSASHSRPVLGLIAKRQTMQSTGSAV